MRDLVWDVKHRPEPQSAPDTSVRFLSLSQTLVPHLYGTSAGIRALRGLQTRLDAINEHLRKTRAPHVPERWYHAERLP